MSITGTRLPRRSAAVRSSSMASTRAHALVLNPASARFSSLRGKRLVGQRCRRVSEQWTSVAVDGVEEQRGAGSPPSQFGEFFRHQGGTMPALRTWQWRHAAVLCFEAQEDGSSISGGRLSTQKKPAS